MAKDLSVRLMGLFSIGVGLVFAWFFMLAPLRQARAGAQEITLHLNVAFAGAPLFVVMGMAFLIGGQAFKEATEPQNPPRMPLVMWLLIGLTLALAGVCYWYVESQFAALGYR